MAQTSLKFSDLTEIANAMTLELLPDGRQRLTRVYNAGGYGQLTEGMLPAYGTPDKVATDLVLVPPVQIESLRELNAEGKYTRKQVLIAKFETLPAAPTEMAAPEPMDLHGVYKNVTCVPTTGYIAAGTNILTVAAANNFCLGSVVRVPAAAFPGIVDATITAIDATGLVWTLSLNASITVTQGNPQPVTGFYTRFAREFTSQLVVAGKGDRFPVGISTPYFNILPATEIQRYFVGETVQQIGTVMAIITRKYAELPDPHTSTEQIMFSRAGSLGAGRAPSTLPAAVSVTRSYSLGPPARTALGYVVRAWATETQSFHVAGDSGGNQTNYVQHPGYLADGYGFSLSGLNTFNGLVCDSVLVTSGSTPAAEPVVPNNIKVISSEPGREPWKGDIWEKVDQSLDFAQFTGGF